MRLMLALALAISSASCVFAEEKPIALKNIWASVIPGTQSVTALDPEIRKELEKFPADEHLENTRQILIYQLKDKSLVYQFLSALGSISEDKQPASGFAVPGTGLDALRNAALSVKKPSNVLPEGDVTVVFFTHRIGGQLELQEITRTDGKVAIQYRVVPNESFARGEYFALIPLGKLPAGSYDVDISTKDKKPATRRVCKPFSFTVEEQ